MYKNSAPISFLIVIVLGFLGFTFSGNSAFAFANFYLPNLRCSVKQSQFVSEIAFNRNPNRFGRKGFLGTVSNFVVAPNRDKRLISSQAFKDVVTQHQNQITGSVGDELSTTGSFTLINLSPSISGKWSYTATDVAGAITQQDFKCYYSTANPKQQR